MKVKIGPYLNWWGPYQIWGLLRKIGFSEDFTDSMAEKSPKWFTDFCEWIYNKRTRYVKIKIDKYDVWSMDSTLAMIIIKMLKLLKETKHGSPNLEEFSQTSDFSVQRCFDFYKDADSIAWDKGHEHWTQILDDMIWSFEQIQPDYDWEDQYCIVKAEIDFDSDNDLEFQDKFLKPLKWKTEGKYDFVGIAEHRERMKRGFMYFGEYYQSLWD